MLLYQLDPPIQYILTLVKPFCFNWYVIPQIKNRGLSVNPWPFPTVLTMKTSKKNHRSHVRLAWWRRPVASSDALDLLHWAMRMVMYGRIAHHHGHQNGHLFRCICWLLFVCLLPWQPLGRCVASSCPMAASSGFRSSPGHAASGDAVCIAPTHCCGHQNGWQTRCIHSSSSILSSTITVAK